MKLPTVAPRPCVGCGTVYPDNLEYFIYLDHDAICHACSEPLDWRNPSFKNASPFDVSAMRGRIKELYIERQGHIEEATIHRLRAEAADEEAAECMDAIQTLEKQIKRLRAPIPTRRDVPAPTLFV